MCARVYVCDFCLLLIDFLSHLRENNNITDLGTNPYFLEVVQISNLSVIFAFFPVNLLLVRSHQTRFNHGKAFYPKAHHATTGRN